jgi:hypothetical protein
MLTPTQGLFDQFESAVWAFSALVDYLPQADPIVRPSIEAAIHEAAGAMADAAIELQTHLQEVTPC